MLGGWKARINSNRMVSPSYTTTDDFVCVCASLFATEEALCQPAKHYKV